MNRHTRNKSLKHKQTRDVYLPHLLGETLWSRNQTFLTRSTIFLGTTSSSMMGREDTIESVNCRRSGAANFSMACSCEIIFIGHVVRVRRAAKSNHNIAIHMLCYCTMADPRPMHPPFENFWGFVFVNVVCITGIYLNCGQHAMFAICILFSTLTIKIQGICEGASIQSPDLKNSTVPGPCPLS